jgi:hypothetical protein
MGIPIHSASVRLLWSKSSREHATVQLGSLHEGSRTASRRTGFHSGSWPKKSIKELSTHDESSW